jgi:cob(I)alamin adenosyltransferase
MTGYVHVYTGDGKGKTTAALGLALRAAGAGLKVYLAQFVKGMHYSELEALKRFKDLIRVKQYGRRCFIREKPDKEDVRLAREGLADIKKRMLSGRYHILILDEANIAIFYKLFSAAALLKLLAALPEHVEVIITGRNADAKIIERADLVTEMREIKHYYQRGIQARMGIEK